MEVFGLYLAYLEAAGPVIALALLVLGYISLAGY